LIRLSPRARLQLTYRRRNPAPLGRPVRAACRPAASTGRAGVGMGVVDDGATYDMVDLPGRKGVVASRSVHPPSLPEISAVWMAVGCSRATVGSTISPKVGKGVVVVAAPKWPHARPPAPNEVNPRPDRLLLARRRRWGPRSSPRVPPLSRSRWVGGVYPGLARGRSSSSSEEESQRTF
jgi:hypothetical protein